MANVQTEDVKEVNLFDLLPDGTGINFVLVLAGGALYRATPAQVAASTQQVLPMPDGPTFADFLDTEEGGSVRLVVFPGVPMNDYRYKIGANGPYERVPTDGVISVGNAVGPVFAYSIGTADRGQSATHVSPLFTTGTGGGSIPGPTTLSSYFGPVASPTPSDDDVVALASNLWAKAPRVLSFSCNNAYPAFAEPQSYGVRNIIQDANGYNITSDVDRTSILLPVGEALVPYWLYVHANAQTDPTFIFSL